MFFQFFTGAVPYRLMAKWGLLYALVNANAQTLAQDLWPRHSLSAGVGLAWQRSLPGQTVEGPDRAFKVMGIHLWNLHAAYTYKHAKGWLFGADVRMIAMTFGITATLDRPEDTGGKGTGNEFRYVQPLRFAPMIDHFEYTLSAGRVLWQRSQWRLDGAVVAGIVPMWSSVRGYGFIHYAPTDSSSQVAFFGFFEQIGLDIWPIYGVTFSLHHRLRSMDQLTLQVNARTTPSGFYTGYYNLYPNTDNPTKGVLPEVPLAYIGIDLGYTFTWGSPKVPKWMRNNSAPVP